MSNEAKTPITKVYPVFEANQVLSHDHLNGLNEYLVGEILATRNQLIGTGILHGLTFEPTEDGITITGGAGISTDGYLISSRAESQHYRCAIPYAFKKDNDPMPDQVLESLTDRVVQRNGQAVNLAINLTGQVGDLTVSYYEMVLDDDPRLVQNEEKKDIKSLLPTGKEVGIALYLETNDIDVESCFTTNCDERGIERELTIRPLLIITNKDTSLNIGFERPIIPALRRIIFAHENAPDLATAYSNALNDGMLDELQNAIDRTDTHLNKYLRNRPQRSNAHALKEIKSNLLTHNPQYLPCFYEWIRDLSRALKDLLDVAKGVELLTHVLPDTFAEHLMLGPIAPGSSHFTRTEFVSVHPSDENEKRIEEIRFYWKRLMALKAGFKPSQQAGIKITPSHTDAHDLSTQSIPYYYADLEATQVHVYWNYDLNASNRSEEVLSYHSSDYTNASHLVNPLDYDHEAKDSLLIEDYIGLQKSEAVAKLQALKKAHHLGFGIVALRVSSTNHTEEYPLPAEEDPLAIREDNFKNFIEENPGLHHARGIRKDGTLALIFKAEPDDTDGVVVAGLALPYICCGVKTIIEEPEPFVLDAHDDEVAVDAGVTTEINVLINDEFDLNNPVELDLIDDFTIDAVDEEVEASPGETIEIDALNNDLYDTDSTIDVELISELDANDVEASVLTGETTNIDVLENDNTDSGDVELDFADQP